MLGNGHVRFGGAGRGNRPTDKAGTAPRPDPYGCGDGGTAIDLTLKAGPARDFREALAWLADRANVSPMADDQRSARPQPATPAPAPIGPDAAARHALDAYARACADHLRSPAGLEVRQWLVEVRGLSDEVIDAAGVGADPGPWKLPRPHGIPTVSPAAVFPVHHDGEVVFTLSRAIRPLPDRPRWWNTATRIAPNPRVALLGPSGPPPAGPVVVTEGMIDALSVLDAGMPSVALLGTGLVDPATADRLARVGRPLVVATDNDAAGHRARDRLISFLRDRGISVRALAIPDRFNDLNDWHVAAKDQWPRSLRASIRLSSAAAERGIEPLGIA